MLDIKQKYLTIYKMDLLFLIIFSIIFILIWIIFSNKISKCKDKYTELKTKINKDTLDKGLLLDKIETFKDIDDKQKLRKLRLEEFQNFETDDSLNIKFADIGKNDGNAGNDGKDVNIGDIGDRMDMCCICIIHKCFILCIYM